jgi:hypothetical protein
MYVCIPVSLLCMEKLLHKPVVEIILEPFDTGGTGGFEIVSGTRTKSFLIYALHL